ncbi:DUF4012 domain-containing protein [Ilumatobacter nonamiensis]|uniref:DUF4012 domain-containing protein n=1 Tax=Ilumatobacter nonamiensis TaxID=467093 RepID=UPI00034CEF86|nr:DUF4012 domain-containing protein [Ilumatobacter nonamiensis]
MADDRGQDTPKTSGYRFATLGPEASTGIVVAVAVVAAVVAVLAGAEPVGSPTADTVVVAITAFVVTMAASVVPWWLVFGALVISTATAGDATVIAVGVVAGVLYLASLTAFGPHTITAAVAGAVAVNVMLRSDLARFLGFSMIVGGVVFGIVVLAAAMTLDGRVRRIVLITTGLLVAVAVASVAALGLAANDARTEVTSANAAAREGIELLSDGEYDEAAELFDDAASDFSAVDDRLQSPLVAPARIVPGLSQNVRAGSELTAQAADALADAALALRSVDPDSLSFDNGRIDLTAIRDAEEPLVQVQAALDGLQTTIADVRSPWLIDRITEELDELEVELAEEEPRLDTVIEAVQITPQILGGDGPRRYLVLFGSTAEARALGGFIGNYAEMLIDDGQITVTEFERRSDLEGILEVSGATCDGCPSQFVERYGPFGFTSGPDGGVGDKAWSNITMSPHFPHVAEVAQLLYPSSGGDPIDGVFYMDAEVVSTLMSYTDPVDLPEFDVTVNANNALRFILGEQYALGDGANDDRIDALGTLGNAVIGQLLTGSLPGPAVLARDLAPLVDDRRLMFLTTEREEQEFLDEIGVSGSLPEFDPANGGFSVTMTNAGGSKIDVFLEREVDVEIVTSATGDRRLVAEVTLTNHAPTEGLPPVVIGSEAGLPPGTSRLYTTFYGPLGLDSAERDGEELDLTAKLEAGWAAYPLFMDLASEESSTFHLEFDLPDQLDPVDEALQDGTFGEPTLFEQPLSELG